MLLPPPGVVAGVPLGLRGFLTGVEGAAEMGANVAGAGEGDLGGDNGKAFVALVVKAAALGKGVTILEGGAEGNVAKGAGVVGGAKAAKGAGAGEVVGGSITGVGLDCCKLKELGDK